MAVYKGTIAGIGDKNLGANIIKPEFDAKIYKFIIGKNCIIDGLNLNGNTLSPGMCVAEGYRGELKSPLTLDTTAYVYGVFKVNFDSDTLDEFYIETSTTEIIRQDDILHTAGTYYLLLYKNGAAQLSHNYPQNAVYADNTNHINDNGTLGKNVTCPTQAINNNSTKVANTEFVHNQIEEEIGYKEVVIYAHYNALETYTSSKITLQKKADFIIATSEAYKLEYAQNDSYISIDNIPIDFRPSGNDAYLTVSIQGGTKVPDYSDILFYKINNDGSVEWQARHHKDNNNNISFSGWKTK